MADPSTTTTPINPSTTFQVGDGLDIGQSPPQARSVPGDSVPEQLAVDDSFR